MGKKYFMGRVLNGAATQRYMVWDGEKDYRSLPDLNVMGYEMSLNRPPAKSGMIIALAAEPLGRHSLDALLGKQPGVGFLVIWTRDSEVYAATIAKMQTESDFYLQ